MACDGCECRPRLEQLLRQARDELYQARAVVAATRNHTKVTTAALADRHDGISTVIGEIEALIPTPEEAQEDGEENVPHAARS